MGTARPLFKVDRFHDLEARVVRLEKQLEHERALRKDAEKNAARFHALMLQARVNLLAAQKKKGS